MTLAMVLLGVGLVLIMSEVLNPSFGMLGGLATIALYPMSGADLKRAVLLANTCETRIPGNVNQGTRFIQPKLHQRNQAVATCDEFPSSTSRGQLRQGVIDRTRALVFEVGRNHD